MSAIVVSIKTLENIIQRHLNDAQRSSDRARTILECGGGSKVARVHNDNAKAHMAKAQALRDLMEDYK